MLLEKIVRFGSVAGHQFCFKKEKIERREVPRTVRERRRVAGVDDGERQAPALEPYGIFK